MAEGADRTDVAAIYIAIWLEHHGNRLYGVMGLLSWVDWMNGLEWIPNPLDYYDYWSTCGAKNVA